MLGTIVCGVTDTPEAQAAAQQAAAIAARLGLRLVLVHVVEPQRADANVEVILGEVARGLGDEVELRIVRGGRVDELARVAAEEGADASWSAAARAVRAAVSCAARSPASSRRRHPCRC